MQNQFATAAGQVAPSVTSGVDDVITWSVASVNLSGSGEDATNGTRLNLNSGPAGALFSLGNAVSLSLLAVTFGVHAALPGLRGARPGRHLLHLTLALFTAKLALQVNPLFASTPHLCSSVALLQHYFCFAAFLWTNVMAFDLWQEARSCASPGRGCCQTRPPCWLYGLYAWVLPLPVIVGCSVYEVTASHDFSYGSSEHCGVLGDVTLVYSLAVPLVIITVANVVLFVLTAYKPHVRARLPGRRRAADRDGEEVVLYDRSNAVMSEAEPPAPDHTNLHHRPQYGSVKTDKRLETRTVNPGRLSADTLRPKPGTIVTSGLPPSSSYDDLSVARQAALLHDEQTAHLFRYVKMTLLMTFAWLSGFLAMLTDTVQLMIVFSVLNAMQGLFIFVSFTLSPPASQLLMMKVKRLRQRLRRRGKYRKFGDKYRQQQSSAPQQDGGGGGEAAPQQQAAAGEQEQDYQSTATTVTLPVIAELTV